MNWIEYTRRFQRDANTKIGREKLNKPTNDHSKHSVTNENRKLLIDSAKENRHKLRENI